MTAASETGSAGPETLFPAQSHLALPDNGPLRRLPPNPDAPRPDGFLARFDQTTLFYDCFWHQNARSVLLIGPVPVNLKSAFQSAQFRALPSGRLLPRRFFRSFSIQITELIAVPPGTTGIEMRFAGVDYTVAVQPNLGAAFAGHRVLFTLSKDNDPAWVRSWAQHHAHRHGTDAIIFADNGSTTTSREQIIDALSVPGIAKIAFLSMPFAYGAPDPLHRANRYWTQSLQVSVMSLVLRRFAPAAHSILNMDIDELAHAPAGRSVHDLVGHTSHGLLSMKGQWVEPLPCDGAGEGVPTHADFPYRLNDETARFCRAGKWALDPSRRWVKSLKVQPYMHWIEHAPLFARRYAGGAFFWHFRGISNGWKDRRADHRADMASLEIDAELVRTLAT